MEDRSKSFFEGDRIVAQLTRTGEVFLGNMGSGPVEQRTPDKALEEAIEAYGGTFEDIRVDPDPKHAVDFTGKPVVTYVGPGKYVAADHAVFGKPKAKE